jgi:hypothetical protein
MKKNATHISIIIDRSSSMSSMAKEVISGFNSLLNKQIEASGEASMTVVQFDHEYQVLNDFIKINNVKKLDINTYSPRGNTALLDAMGKTIEDVRTKINALEDNEKPSKAIFVFITDGEENWSKQYSRERVFEMIEDLKSESKEENSIDWDFVFIGANQDAISAGGSFGIARGASLTYASSGDGAKSAFTSLSDGLISYRCATKGAAYSFSDEDRKEQEKLMNR